MDGKQNAVKIKNALGVGEREYFKEKNDKYAYLKYTDKVEHNGGGLFAGTYKWDRIETTEQFISENDLTQNVYSGAILDVNVANKITDEGKAALKGKKWLLRFAETSYSLSGSQYSTTEYSTLVSDVTILRLKFETDGITYNLGTIDNKQTGSDQPINDETYDVVVNKRGKWILGLIALILIILLGPVLPYIFQGIFLVISLPFRAIGAARKKSKERRREKQEKEIKHEKKRHRRAEERKRRESGELPDNVWTDNGNAKSKRKQKLTKPPELKGNVTPEEVDSYLDSIDWDSVDWTKLDGKSG